MLFGVDTASSPELRVNGKLRPMVMASLASMIMYYPERADADEVRGVLGRMRNVVSEVFKVPNPDSTLRAWAPLVKQRFDTDNLHLTRPTDPMGHVAALAAHLTQLSYAVTSSTNASERVRQKI